MESLWIRLRSSLATAAGFVLCLAACRPAAPSSDGAARPFLAGTTDAPSVRASPSSAPPPSPAAATPAPSPVRSAAEKLVALSETDPRAALLASAGRNPGPSATYLRGNFLQLWAQRDFTAAFAYADNLPPGIEREEMLGRLALVLAESLPAEAADVVAADMAPGPTRDEAAISVVHRWALAEPAAAEGWASAFPAGPLRERALREVAGVLVANSSSR